MRKFFWLMSLMLVFSVGCLAQEGTNFEDLSFQEALAKAKQLNKKVFVDCYTQSCGPCKMMARRIFPQKVCGDYFNPRYVCIMKDMQQGDGLEIAKKYNVRMYPTFLVLDAEGNLILCYEAGASRDAEVFVQRLKEQVQLVEMEHVYLKGDYDEAFLNQYMDLLENQNPMRLQTVMQEVMMGWSADQLSQPATWNRIKRVLRSPDNTLFRELLAQRTALIQKLGKEEVDAYLMAVYMDEFRTMKAMDIDWAQRMSVLDGLIADKNEAARLLKCRMTCYQIVSKKQTERVDELLKVVKRLKKDFENEEDRVAILKEMMGIQRLVKEADQRKAFYIALEKMLPSFSTHASIVHELMNLLK